MIEYQKHAWTTDNEKSKSEDQHVHKLWKNVLHQNFTAAYSFSFLFLHKPAQLSEENYLWYILSTAQHWTTTGSEFWEKGWGDKCGEKRVSRLECTFCSLEARLSEHSHTWGARLGERSKASLLEGEVRNNESGGLLRWSGWAPMLFSSLRILHLPP